MTSQYYRSDECWNVVSAGPSLEKKRSRMSTQHSAKCVPNQLLEWMRILSRKANRARVFVMLLVHARVKQFRVYKAVCPVKASRQQGKEHHQLQ